MRTSRRAVSASAVGALIAAGALAAPAAAQSTGTTTPRPVSASTTEVPLTPDLSTAPEEDVDPVAPSGPALRTSGAPFSLNAPDVVLTAVSEATGYAVAGVVWDDTDDAEVSSVELRTLSDGTWSPWESIEPEESDKDGAPVGGVQRAGTDPIVVGEVDRVEVRLVADAEPTNARLTVIDPGASAADSAPAPATTSADVPEIFPRAAWGADESIMTWTPQPATVMGTVIHHTAGTNDYTPEQVPAILRGIYTFHAQTNNWGDIGYNFLVDKFGRAWEGRAGGITNATIGAHAFGFNTWTTGISVMGNYTTAAISDPAWDTLVDVTAWKLSERGVDVNGTMTVNGVDYPALVGHRDVGVTECPGDQLYERLDELRAAVSDRQDYYDGPPEPSPEPSPEPEVSPEPEPSPEPEVSPEPEPSPEVSPEPEADQAPGLLGTPPAATVGAPYEFSFTVTGAPRPTVELSSGTLPAGLVLDESGRLSGTPQEPSTSTFTVTASNDVGPDASLDVELVVHAAQGERPDDESPTLVIEDREPGSAGPDGPERGKGDAPPADAPAPHVAPVATGDTTPKGGQLAATGAVVASALGLMVLALGAGAALLRRAQVTSD